ncbi:MAG: DMT family transporter [Jatrophihabitans sp.]
MGVETLLSFLCAGLAAAGNAVANVMQRKASLEQKAPGGFSLRLLGDLVRRRTWVLGFSGMVGSFVLQAVALGLGQLSSVETIITLEVPLTLLVSGWVFQVRIGRSEWGGILVMTAGMIAVVAVLAPKPGNETDVSHSTYAIAGGATAATVALLVLAARRGSRLWRTACLGAAAGTSFGLTATFIKETASQLSDRGLIGVLTTWQTYAAVTMGVLGVGVMQWALHTGPLLAAQPGFTLMDPLVSIFWGVLVYQEVVRSGLWLLPASLGAVAVGVGVILLARSPLLIALDESEMGRVAERLPGDDEIHPVGDNTRLA